MYVVRICCVLLYFGVLRKFVDCTDWVGDLTRYVVEDSEFKQVKIMTRLHDDEILKHPLIEKLFVNLMQNLPTLRINFGEDFELPVNSVPDETVETRTPIDTSSTLFLFLIESNGSLPNLTTTKFINAVAKMTTHHYSPIYLIISFARKPSNDIAELLQYAWTKKILDLTVIEFTETEEQRYLTGIKALIVSPATKNCVIHHFNPFTKEHTRENWSANTNNIFPSKVVNLRGYPLRLHIDVRSLSDEGADDPENTLCAILTEKLNSSVEYYHPPIPYNDSDLWRSLYTAVELDDIDVSCLLYPYSFESWHGTLRTTPIETERYCALVPILSEFKTLVSPDFVKAYSLSFGTTLIFWILMRLLRFDSYSWRMFNIGRLLFGISVAQQPRRTVERIVFTSLLALYAIYSSMIYASITDIVLKKMDEKKFESFEDLVNSGFVAYMHPLDFQMSSDVFAGPLRSLKNRTLQDAAIDNCPKKLFMNENVICFLGENLAKLWITTDRSYGRSSMKIAEPCLRTESSAFIVGKRSPYRQRLDKLIMRLHSSGIISRLLEADPEDAAGAKYNDRQKESHDTHPLYYQLIVLSVVGYSLSLIVFISEIIIHRVSMYRKSKIQPLSGLFPVRNKIRQKNVVIEVR